MVTLAKAAPVTLRVYALGASIARANDPPIPVSIPPRRHGHRAVRRTSHSRAIA